MVVFIVWSVACFVYTMNSILLNALIFAAVKGAIT